MLKLFTVLRRDMLLRCIINLRFVFLVALALGTEIVDSSATAGTCSFKPAMEGGTAEMFITFSPDINSVNEGIHLYLRKESGKNILQCYQENTIDLAECIEMKDDRFKKGAMSGRNLTIHITKVTPDLAGMYTLGGFLNGVGLAPSTCNFTLASATVSADETAVAPIVVPIAVIIVGALIVVAIVMSKRRFCRRQYHGANRRSSEYVCPV